MRNRGSKGEKKTLGREAAFFLAVCLLCVPLARGLDPARRISQYGHEAWRIQEGYLPGLPEVVTQTVDGYLWIGTYAGLVRFDGVRFTPWASISDKQLPDYRIWSLLGGKDGSLWIGTQKGLARWKSGELTAYASPQGRINSILEDDHGDIWIARSQISDGGGALCRVTGNEPRCFGAAEGMPLPSAMRLAKDGAGNIWVSGSRGLCRWKPGSSTTYFEKELNRQGVLLGILALVVARDGSLWISLQQRDGSLQLEHFTNDRWEHQNLPGLTAGDPAVSALLEDRDGTLWVGTGLHGVYRIGRDGIDHFSSADGLSADAIAGLFQDREGTLWVASSEGLDSFRDLPVVSFSLKEGLSGDSVTTVLAARDGTVWIGTSGALDSIKGNKISAIRTNAGLPGRDITTMFEDHLGRLWLGIDSGLFVFEHGAFRAIRNADGTPPGIVYDITEDTKNSIWVHAGIRLVCLDRERVRKVVDEPVVAKSFALAADPEDGIWLGSGNGDLARYRNDRLEMYPADRNVSSAQIRQILPEADGTVLAVTENGLVWWKDGKRAVLSTKNGLPCDELYTVVKDEQGRFWIYSRCGLFSLTAAGIKDWETDTTRHVEVKLFDVFDGVQAGITQRQPQGTRSPDGHLWFANESILQTIDPRSVPRNTLVPNVLVEKIVADGKIYSPNEEFRLPALTRNLEVDYTAPSFVVPQKVHFRYELEGHDTGWQDVETRRQAFYSDLPPGKYRFRVVASNNDGVWNEVGATTEFSMAPAFFQTFWFLLLCASSLLAAMWFLYLLRMRQVAAGIRARMEGRLGERERIARELHDTLLQGIQGLILRFHAMAKQIPTDAALRRNMDEALDRAEQVVTEGRERVLNLRASGLPSDLAEGFRQVASDSGEKGTAELRVVLEGSSRAVHPWVSDEVYAVGREAIVNAFRHSGCSQVEVEVIYDFTELRLRVRDDGRGMDPAVLKAGGREGHWGMRGMRERANNIGARLQIWSGPGRGTEVDLRVPAVRAYPAEASGARWFWLRSVLGRNR